MYVEMYQKITYMYLPFITIAYSNDNDVDVAVTVAIAVVRYSDHHQPQLYKHNYYYLVLLCISGWNGHMFHSRVSN
jgi:hypothetical protein